MAVNWVHVANAESNGSDDITIPNTASAGDVAFFFDTAASFGGAPSKVVPAGFEEIVSFTGTTIARSTISYKILEVGDPGSVITGQSGDALEVKNMVVVSSDEDAINGIAVKSLNSEATTDDPAQQTVTGSDEFVAGGPPIITFANYASGSAITSDSFSPARDGELDNAGSDQITAWRFDNLDALGDPTAQDTTVDMADEGTNSLASFYVVPDDTIAASGSPQADDATAGGAPSEYSCEIVATPSANQDGVLYQRDDGTEDNRVRFARVAGDLHVIVTTGGVEQADLNLGALTDFTEFTVRAAFADNDIAASLNGAAAVTDNTVTLPDPALLSHRRHGADSTGTSWNAWIRDNREYPSRVPNAELENGTSASGIALIADGALTAYTTLTRNSTATYWDASSELQTAAIDTARTDHDPADGSLRGFLSEEGRTNLVTQSEDLTHGDWVQRALTVSSLSTSKFPNAFTLTADAVDNIHVLRQPDVFTLDAGRGGYRFALKMGTHRFVKLQFRGNSGSIGGTFDLQNGTIADGGGQQNTTNPVYKIRDIGDGWYECSVFGDLVSGDSDDLSLYMMKDNGGAVGSAAWLADGTETVHVAAPEAEQPVPDDDHISSYIPTTTAAATREADNATSTVPALAFAKIQASGSPQADDATTSGEIGLLGKASGSAQAEDATAAGSAFPLPLEASGSPQADEATATGDARTIHRASGAPQAEDAQSSGSADVNVKASGSPQSEDATTGGSAEIVSPVHYWKFRRDGAGNDSADDLSGGIDLTASGDAEFTNGLLPRLILKFSMHDQTLEDEHIPAITGLSTAPSELGPGEFFGKRASGSVSLADFPFGDFDVDKYREERISGAAQADGKGFDPKKQGTFWGKWRARNAESWFRRPVRVKQILQGVEVVRHYVIDKIEGPNRGSFSISFMDPMIGVEGKEAQAPIPNNGTIDNTGGISDTDTSITLSPAGIGDDEYSASGKIAVGREVMEFTRAGDTITLTERGALNTTAESHKEGDTVQEVYSPSGTADEIQYELYTKFADVDPKFIDRDAWATEASDHIGLNFTANITKPTSVKKLSEELMRQAGYDNFWDDVDQEIKFVALKNPDSAAPIIGDGDIVQDSIRVSEQPKKRISQVWIAFDILDPTQRIQDENNYGTTLAGIDPGSQGVFKWGRPRIEKIFGRWMTDLTQARQVRDKILTRFARPPRSIEFDMPPARDLTVRPGDVRRISHDDLQRDDGKRELIPWQILAIERGMELIHVKAEEFRLTAQLEQETNVFISSDTTNYNFREAWESVWGEPQDGDTATVEIFAGVIVGSDDTSIPAFDVGDWPAGVTLKIINKGRIQGKGGRGGDFDGDQEGDSGAEPGLPGGTALYTRLTIELDNQSEIWSGGGGGSAGFFGVFGGGPKGGGGGAGYEPGEGGIYTNTEFGQSLQSGSGTTESGGDPNGGDPAQDGGDASKSGGAAGTAVDGDSFITYTTAGDIRGPQIN